MLLNAERGPLTAREWYLLQGCTHAHCPYDCEHPQPVFGVIEEALDGEWSLFCGRCLLSDLLTHMVPCVPGSCADLQ